MPRHRADTTAANCALEKEVSYLRMRNYSAPDRGARSIGISVSICLSVRLSVRDHISGTARPMSTTFSCV